MVPSLLTGPNYHIWARAFRRCMISKHKFGFLDGSIPIPDTFHPLYPMWERCNTLIHTWLTNSVSANIAKSIDAIENIADVWRVLRERFSQCDMIRIGKLQHELYGLQQGPLAVNEFFTELSSL